MDSVVQREGSITSSDSGGSGSWFVFPAQSSSFIPSQSSSFPSYSGSSTLPLGYRRGPGRPRKDGNVPFQRMSGRGNVGRVRIKSQLIGGFQRIVSGSSSSPSTSSPDTPAGWEPGEDSPNPLLDPFLHASSSEVAPRCAFCNLSANSCLGQGDLLQHPKSPEFDFDSVIVKREVESERIEPAQSRYPQLPQRPRTKEEIASLYRKGEIFSEIEIIGLPDDIQLQDLISPSSGECFAHFCCGAWSDGVIQSEDYSLINVDKAVLAGLQQRCSGCGSYGATISCKQKGCLKKYHYPCASGFGGFLDIRSLVFLCPDHLSKAPEISGKEAECKKCKKIGQMEDCLFCTSCGQHFHGTCLDPAVEPSLQTRAGWLCNECKICQHCRSAGDDDRMLVCDSCDKGYHTYCMQPVLSSIPKHTWKCKFCRVCKDCGSRRPGSGASSRWHLNYSICDSCYQQRNKGLVCPVCNRAYRHQREKSMVQCSSCNKHIHNDCDPQAALRSPEDLNYVCPICKRNPEVAGGFCGRASASASVSASPSISTVDEQEEEEAELLAAFMKNEMGTDSLSGTESPFSELGPEFGDVDFESLTTPEQDSNMSGVQSGSESGIGCTAFPVSWQVASRKQGGGNILSRKKPTQYRRSRSSGKGPEVFRCRFPGTAGSGRRRGRPSKYSTSVGVPSVGDDSNGNGSKEKDDEEYIHTVVVTYSKDEFVLCQDMCVVCGSFGKGEEGRLIACTQCGQCYHSYCANIKMSLVVLRRGWRCLDCTVCEGCGQGEDEPHLLLCDECDVSFHTYCLDPPLEHIPLGAWRCQWCAKCQRCGSALGSAHSSFPNNFCPSCESLCKCCRCNLAYKDGEQIIVCQNCGRWCHGKCEGLLNDDLLETASERGFRCAFCRPTGSHCLSISFYESLGEDQSSAVDGVILTKLGVDISASKLGTPIASTPVSNVGAVRKHLSDSRCRAGGLGGAARAIQDTIDEVTAAVTKTFTGQASNEECSTVEMERTDSVEDLSVYDIMSPGSSGVDSQPKRRGRRVPKPGVGGFIVRPSRHRASTVDELSEGQDINNMAVNEDLGTVDNGGMISPAMDTPGEKLGQAKQKRKRKPRRGIIEDSYPSIIQDSFFGQRCLSETFNQSAIVNQSLPDSPILDEQNQAFHLTPENRDCELSHLSADQLRKEEAGASSPSRPLSLDELDDDLLLHSISGDQELMLDSESLFQMLENIGGGGAQDSRGQSPITQHDIDRTPLVTDLGDVDSIMHELNPSLNSDSQQERNENVTPGTFGNQQGTGNGQLAREIKVEEPSTQSLDPQSVIVAPQNPIAALQSPQQMINQVPAEFVPQEIRQQPPVKSEIIPTQFPPPPPQHPHEISGVGPGFFAQQMGHQGPREPPPFVVMKQGVPAAGQGIPPGFGHPMSQRPLMSTSIQQAPQMETPPLSTNSQQTSSTSSGNDLKSQMERWEHDEPLGEKSTIAAVLYTNINHQDFKLRYPTWQERVKHIMKQWRVLNPEERARYVQMARENRAACRQKTRKSSKNAGAATSPCGIGAAGSFVRQESLAGHSEASKSPISNPPTPYAPGPPTPSTPSDHPLAQSPYSPRGLRPLFPPLSDPQIMQPHLGPGPRMHFPSQDSAGLRFPMQQFRYISPQEQHLPESSNPFKVPQRPEGHQQEPPVPSKLLASEGFPTRPTSLMFRGPNPASGPNVQPQSQNHLLLDELMEEERRERSQQEGENPNASQAHLPVPLSNLSHPGQLQHGFPNQGWPVQRFPGPPQGHFIRTTIMPQVFKDPHHESLFRKQEELNSLQKMAEDELARLRKTKKNIAAKQRQLKKNGQELSEEEKMNLDGLTREIQEKQKRVEQAKKQTKQNAGQLHDYEVKNGIVYPEKSSPQQQPCRMRPPVPGLQMPPQSSPMFHPPPHGPMVPGQTPRGPLLMRGHGQIGIRQRGPPPQAFAGATNSTGLTSPYTVMQGDTNPFSETFEERERIERQKQFVTQFVVRPTYSQQQMQDEVVQGEQSQYHQFQEGLPHGFLASASQSEGVNEKRKQYKKRRKKKESVGGSDFGTPTDLLLNIPRPPLSSLDSPVKEERTLRFCGVSGSIRDVYETVQFLIDRISLEVDGDEGDKENALLKRLLQNSSPSDKEMETSPRGKCIGRPAAAGGKRGGVSSGGPLKKRKKGPKGKLVTPSPYDDYNGFIERVSVALKALLRLSVQEPYPRADRFSCQIPGTTNLPDRADKPLVITDKMGDVHLSFQPDFFTEIFGKTAPKQLPVSAGISSNVQISKTEEGQVGKCRANNFNAKHSLLGGPASDRCAKDLPSQPSLPVNQQAAPKTIIERLQSLDEDQCDLVYEELNAESEEQEMALAYPALKMAIPVEGRLSPNFRLMLAIPTMRPVPPDPPRDLFYRCPKKEAHPGREVPVTVTLGVEAARNVSNVMQELALLLNLSSPIEYHIETPPHTPEKDGSIREISDQGLQQCRQCNALVEQEAVKKRFAELGLTPKEDDKDYALFCSSACFSKFSMAYKTPLSGLDSREAEKLAIDDSSKQVGVLNPEKSTVVDTVEKVAALGGGKDYKTDSHDESRTVTSGVADDFKLEEIIRSVVGGVQSYSSGPKENMVHVRDLPQPACNQTDSGRHGKVEKRWKGRRWQVWNRSIVANFTRLQDQLNELIEELRWRFCPSVLPKDCRKCELCAGEGDADMEGPGRLLNLDAARWLHVNCALWSSEVYETVGGALINVDAAVRRGQTVTCVHCSQLGATIPCYKLRCEQQYHFPCALETGCCFTTDKTLLCPDHKVCDKDKYVELNRLAVLRRVYVERDEDHLIAKLFQQGEQAGLALRVGNLIFHHVGQLLPHQLRSFHTKDFVFPVGYSVTRFYWSPAFLNRRVKYHCSITEHAGSPQFVLSYSDYGCSELTVTDISANHVWSKILDPLERLRHKHGCSDQLKLFPRYLTGEMLYGLTEPSILKMIESLPGVETLLTYNFKYGRSPLMDLPLAVNPSGCARCEPRFRTYFKRHHTLHAAGGTGGSGSACSPTSSGSLTWQELALMFGKMEQQAAGNSSKWSLYKKMKADWRNTVYLARSKIQGLGLYAKKDIEMNAMIIEYLGDVIRNEVAERREKLYQQQNRGVYMFRLDTERVVDATMSGGPARYINHSCDPNCATQLVTINGDLKIVVVACRPISQHEELTYDYQFDFEDENSKIPCLCGAPNCRKWMN